MLPIKRKRQLKDAIQQAVLYTENGLLTTLPSSDPQYLDEAARELAIVAAMTVPGAKRVLKLISLRRNEDLWQYFHEHPLFRVFTASDFCNQPSDNMDVDLLWILSSETKVKEGKLTQIALSMEAEARDRLIVWFFKLAGVVSTLAGWAGQEEASTVHFRKVFRRYLAPTWNTSQMFSQKSDMFSTKNMGIGWQLVNAVFTVLLDPFSNDSGSGRTISLASIERKLPEFIKNSLLGLVVWMYSILGNHTKSELYVAALLSVVTAVQAKLFAEFRAEGDFSEESTSINGLIMRDLLEEVDRGNCSVADFKINLALLSVQKPELGSEHGETKKSLSKVSWDDDHKKELEVNYVPETPFRNLQHGETNKSLLKVSWGDDHKKELEVNYVPETPVRNHSPTVVLGTPPPRSEQPYERAHRPRLKKLQESGQRMKQSLQKLRERIPQRSPRARTNFQALWSARDQRLENGRFNVTVMGKRANTDFDGNRWTKRFKQTEELGDRTGIVDACHTRMKTRPERAHDDPPPRFSREEDIIENGTFEELHQELNVADGEVRRLVDPAPKANETTPGEIALNRDLEGFYAEALKWTIHHESPKIDNVVDTRANRHWIRWFCQRYQRDILPDVTLSQDIISYCTHWKLLLQLELRGLVADEVLRKWPNIAESSQKFHDVVYGSHYVRNFVRLVTREISNSRLLTNCKCESNDVKLNTMLLREMRGASLGVGYLQSSGYGYGDCSPLRVVLIRRVYASDDDIDRVALEGKVRRVILLVAVERRYAQAFGLEPGDVLHLQVLCSLAPIARMFVAVHMAYELPQRLLDMIFGTTMRSSSLRRELVKRTEDHDVRPLHQEVDPGCLAYLKRLYADKKLNHHQFESLVIVLSQIGNAAPGSSSMSLILGPPGTGKTTSIANLIGALLHHSGWGHVNRQPLNLLNKKDGVLRCSKHNGALKILVCAGSNQGVDNCLRKLAQGIPDGYGNLIFVNAVRTARLGYEYKDLKSHSLNVKALELDNEYFNKPPANEGSYFIPHKNASLKAKREVAREAIVFLFTNTLSGGAAFSELKADCDVVINDDVSMLLEPEGLIPMVASVKHSRLRRLHSVGVGDFNQLSRYSNTAALVRHGQMALHFNYEDQLISQFERLDKGSRCPTSILLEQYRMHHVISRPHAIDFYQGVIQDGSPIKTFMAPYNALARDGVGYFPFTFWDTCMCKSRIESNDGEGNITNGLEANLVHRAINNLSGLCHGHGDNLNGKIAVIAPYRAQVNEIRYMISERVMRRMDIIVDTVEAMQGAERDIVIFSSTRSNDLASIGFFNNRKRLNVVVSRAKKLLLIIGDSETLKHSTAFSFLLNWCREKRHGAGMLTVRPAPGDELAPPPTRGTSMVMLRRAGGYNLRSGDANQGLSRNTAS